jgi:CRISPR-associated protein (TIGR02584 family)
MQSSISSERLLNGNSMPNASTKGPQKQIVLLSLVGTTPAVLTETVYALAHRKRSIIPDRVIAVTSSGGRSVLVRQLFEDGAWQALRHTLKTLKKVPDSKLRFGPIPECIRVFPTADRKAELEDIRTAEDNETVAEFLMELVRSFTDNDSIQLIVSIAGGRKTTSALLHSVVTLLGRGDDMITHIIVSDPWSSIPHFYFPGCPGTFKDPLTGKTVRSKDARLDLAEVPFVPLRYLFTRELERSPGSYLQLMQQLRSRAINIADELSVRLNTSSGELVVNGKTVRLGPNEFLLYLYFAKRAKGRGKPIDALVSVEHELANLKKANSRPTDLGHWASRALDSAGFNAKEDLRKWIASIRKHFRDAGFDPSEVDRLVPHRGYLAIDVPAEHIEIV